MWCKRVLLRVIVGMRSSCSASAECNHRNHEEAGSNLSGFFNWYFAPIYVLLVNWLLRFWNLSFYAKGMLKSFSSPEFRHFGKLVKFQQFLFCCSLFKNDAWMKKVLLNLFDQWHVPSKYLIEPFLGPEIPHKWLAQQGILFFKDFSLNLSVLSLLRLKQHNSANTF